MWYLKCFLIRSLKSIGLSSTPVLTSWSWPSQGTSSETLTPITYLPPCRYVHGGLVGLIESLMRFIWCTEDHIVLGLCANISSAHTLPMESMWGKTAQHSHGSGICCKYRFVSTNISTGIDGSSPLLMLQLFVCLFVCMHASIFVYLDACITLTQWKNNLSKHGFLWVLSAKPHVAL